MKKRTLLAMALLLGLFTGCGAATDGTLAIETTAINEEAPAEMVAEAETELTETTTLSDSQTSDPLLDEKIIYTAYAELETTDFDSSLDAVSSLLETHKGFIESSTVTGNDLQSDAGYSCRSASYVLRFPRESYTAVTSDLSGIGNVTYLSSDATNITTQYTDTESRLTAYRTEETRLLEILGQAETVEDMISVESRLSEIRYEIEQLTTQLKNWDNQVSYSTVTLYIQEVTVLTPVPVEKLTYWQEVGQALHGSISWMGQTAKTLFKILIAGLPILLPLCLIVGIPLVVRRKKRAAKKSTPPPDIYI